MGQSQQRKTGLKKAAAGAAAGVSAAPRDTLVYAMASDVVGLSPTLTNDRVSSSVINQIYETLFRRNPDTNQIEPLLAVSYETPDPNTWVIKLRRGVRFHDGTPFDAQAVKFTFDRLRDPKVAAPRASLLQSVESVEARDEFTVVIKTKYPYGAFLAALTHVNSAIESPAAVRKYGNLMNNPVGTGPFRFRERVPGDRIVLEANPDYWGGAPRLEQVVFRVVPEAATRVNLLTTGEVDFLDDVPPELVPVLEANPEVVVERSKGSPVQYLGFNHQKSPWNNLLVRRAVRMAIDVDQIVGLLEGQGYLSAGVIGPMVFGYKPSIEERSARYDPGAARELLARAGYPQGFATELWYASNNPVAERIATAIQGMLGKVGIRVQLRSMEWGAYLAATRDPKHDLYLLGWTNVTQDGSELVYPNLHKDNIGASNRSFYDNPEVNRLIDESRQVTDQARRLEILNEVNEKLLDDVAWVTLYHANNLIAYRQGIKGLRVYPNTDWFLYAVGK